MFRKIKSLLTWTSLKGSLRSKRFQPSYCANVRATPTETLATQAQNLKGYVHIIPNSCLCQHEKLSDM